jgi:hypothetical protein
MTEEQAQYIGQPNKDIASRIIRLKLIDGTQVNGHVNINRDRSYDRLSDLICNDQDGFLVLFGVTSYHKDIDNPVKLETLFVNKRYIVWATPDEDQV